MSTDQERQCKDLEPAQNRSKAAGHAGEQSPGTRFFGWKFSGSQSGSINRNSPSSELLGKTGLSIDFRKYVQNGPNVAARFFAWATAGSPSVSTSRIPLSSETLDKTEVSPECWQKAEDDDCTSLFGRTGEQEVGATAHAQPTNPTVREYGISPKGDGTPHSTRIASTDEISGRGTGSLEKPGIEAKKDLLMGRASKSCTPKIPTSEKVHNTSKAAGDSTIRASSFLKEPLSDLEKPVHPTASDLVERHLDSKKLQPAVLSPPSLFERGDSPGLSEQKSQSQDTSTKRPKDMEVHESRPAMSPPHDRETALPSHESPRNSQSRCYPCEGGVALPSGNAHGQLTPGSDYLSNTPSVDIDSAGLQSKGKTRSRHPPPETPVPFLRRSLRIQMMNAIEAAKQGLRESHWPLPPTPVSAAVVRCQSSLSAFPSMLAPKRSAQVEDALDDPDRTYPCFSVSQLADPFTSTPESPSRTAFIAEVDKLAGGYPLIKNEPLAGDDSHSDVALSPIASDRYRRSQSAPLLQKPSSGSPAVVCKWSSTTQRQKMLPPFLWTVQTMCKDLTKSEIPKGHIYAFSVDDPQMNNYVKIGFSANLKKRSKNHQTCYGLLRQIYPPAGQGFIQVDHAGRVEHLIHAELVRHALEIEQCPNPRSGHKSHHEWYDVEHSHAIAVIEKWSHWMSSSPYEEGPPIVITKKQSPSGNKASGNSLKAKSPKSKSPGPRGRTSKSKSPSPKMKTSHCKSPQTPAAPLPTTRWYLTDIGPMKMLDLCWPMSRCAYTPEGDGIDEVQTKLRRHSIG
jgi:T5orf172 domain